MSLLSRLVVGAALVSGLGMMTPGLATADDPHYRGGAPRGDMDGFGSPSREERGMPPHGFRDAPPNFRHEGPRLQPPGRAPQTRVLRPERHVGTFRGRGFGDLPPEDRQAWRRGVWRHEEHDGHLGWWWLVDGSWFFYPQPIYPYPTYIGPDYYYDYSDQYGEPPYYWYHCEDPAGYYPYVQDCNVPWQQVPPMPDDDD